MVKQSWIFRLVIFCIVISGCKSPDPNPEIGDRIYSDLQGELRAAEAAVEENNGKLEAARKSLETSRPRTPELRQAKDDINKFSSAIARAEEMVEYYKIRVARRYAQVRHDYKVAFHGNKPWPQLKEWENYVTNKKLVTAPRNWSERLASSRAATAPAAKPAETDAKTGGGGGH